MTNNIKLQTLMRFYAGIEVELYDIQYEIHEKYTKKEILQNKQLCKMKVISFTGYHRMLRVIVVE